MSTAEQERESEVVVGAVVGITQKRPDTWTVEVKPDGSQYSRNLWTKDVALTQALPRYINQRLAFTCGVSHWTNQQNQPVRSLWINETNEAPPEGAQTVGQIMQSEPVAQQAQQQGQVVKMLQQPLQVDPTPTQRDVRQEVVSAEQEREIRIMRQTAAKCAVWELATLPPEERTHPHLVLIAEGWFAYFTRGPESVPNLPPTGEVQGTATQMEVSGLGPSPIGAYAPDDIPF